MSLTAQQNDKLSFPGTTPCGSSLVPDCKMACVSGSFSRVSHQLSTHARLGMVASSAAARPCRSLNPGSDSFDVPPSYVPCWGFLILRRPLHVHLSKDPVILSPGEGWPASSIWRDANCYNVNQQQMKPRRNRLLVPPFFPTQQIKQNMKKLLIPLLTITLCFGAFAEDPLDITAEGSSLFKAHEFNSISYYQFRADDLGHLDSLRGDGVGIGASYYLTKHFGGFASVLADEHLSTPVDSLSFGLRARMPFNTLAPYALTDVIYDIRASDTSYLLGGGLEWRLSEHWGAFGEAGWEFDRDQGEGILGRLGASFRF